MLQSLANHSWPILALKKAGCEDVGAGFGIMTGATSGLRCVFAVLDFLWLECVAGSMKGDVTIDLWSRS